MICPACTSGFVQVLASCPVRRYQCAACNHVWAEEHDTAPPPTLPTGKPVLRFTREQWIDIQRTVNVAVFDLRGGRYECDSAIVEVAGG